MKIFKTIAQVTLRPEHPKYWECQNGVLFIFFYASDSATAITKAKVMLSELFYEIENNIIVAVEIQKQPTDSVAATAYQIAEQVGIGICGFFSSVGKDRVDLITLASEIHLQNPCKDSSDEISPG